MIELRISTEPTAAGGLTQVVKCPQKKKNVYTFFCEKKCIYFLEEVQNVIHCNFIRMGR